MVYRVWSASIRQGKAQEAFEWAAKLATYVNENYTDISPEGKIEVVRNINGPVNQLRIVAKWESLAVLEQGLKRGAEDPDYQELLAEAAGLFVESSAVVNYSETVP